MSKDARVNAPFQNRKLDACFETFRVADEH